MAANEKLCPFNVRGMHTVCNSGFPKRDFDVRPREGCMAWQESHDVEVGTDYVVSGYCRLIWR